MKAHDGTPSKTAMMYMEHSKNVRSGPSAPRTYGRPMGQHSSEKMMGPGAAIMARVYKGPSGKR